LQIRDPHLGKTRVVHHQHAKGIKVRREGEAARPVGHGGSHPGRHFLGHQVCAVQENQVF
jgi:hypothetical protein